MYKISEILRASWILPSILEQKDNEEEFILPCMQKEYYYFLSSPLEDKSYLGALIM